jgi:hypothetical protein
MPFRQQLAESIYCGNAEERFASINAMDAIRYAINVLKPAIDKLHLHARE